MSGETPSPLKASMSLYYQIDEGLEGGLSATSVLSYKTAYRELRELYNKAWDCIRIQDQEIRRLREELETRKAAAEKRRARVVEVSAEVQAKRAEDGLRLARHREAKGLTKYRLAKMAGVNESLLSRIESGKSTITVESAVRLAAALGIAAGDLLADTRREQE